MGLGLQLVPDPFVGWEGAGLCLTIPIESEGFGNISFSASRLRVLGQTFVSCRPTLGGSKLRGWGEMNFSEGGG